jgi:hypothetical protein
MLNMELQECNYSIHTVAEVTWEHLNISTSLDHGKGHSRITVPFIACWQINNGEWNEEEYSCTIENARCKKEYAKLIMNTFGLHRNNHLKEIHTID